MSMPNVVDGAAVGNNVAVEAPLAAQNIRHQLLVCATRLTVRAVVSTHHRVGPAFHDRRAKSGQISFAQIAFVSGRVETVTLRFRTTMHCVMFRRGYYFEVARVITLQSAYELNAKSCGEIRIFAVGFLAASPTWIAKDVDVRTPESQSLVTAVLVVTQKLVMLR